MTPYRLDLYRFLAGYSDTFYFTHIEEWVPVNWYPIEYWRFLYAGIVAAALILIVYFAISKTKYKRTPVKINLWFFALALLFLYLSFHSKRHFPLLFAATLPWVVEYFSRELAVPDNWLRDYTNGRLKWLLHFLKFLVIACFVLVIAVKALKINSTNDPFNAYCSSYPCQAVAFLKTQSEYKNLRLFSQYGWGGYLIYTWPEEKLFIDGRLPQYPFAGQTLLAEYYDFFDPDKLENKLNQYDIKLVLIRNQYPQAHLNWFEKNFLFLNEGRLNNQANPLKDYLDNAGDWQTVYRDKLSLVYKKLNNQAVNN